MKFQCCIFHGIGRFLYRMEALVGTMNVKTNPMRYLDKLGIKYDVHCYGDTMPGGLEIAEKMGEDPDKVFKTLVTVGQPKNYYVFCVPVSGELDLKKAAASVGEKSVSMIPSKDLLQLTGYVHGGCTPYCIKRPMKVTVDVSAKDHDRIYISAGKVGYQLELSITDFERSMDLSFADIRKV